jgi:hypothetical protein
MVRADTVVARQESSALNRYSNIARFQTLGINDPQPLRPRHAAALARLRSNGFAMSGVEFGDGVALAQS